MEIDRGRPNSKTKREQTCNFDAASYRDNGQEKENYYSGGIEGLEFWVSGVRFVVGTKLGLFAHCWPRRTPDQASAAYEPEFVFSWVLGIRVWGHMGSKLVFWFCWWYTDS